MRDALVLCCKDMRSGKEREFELEAQAVTAPSFSCSYHEEDPENTAARPGIGGKVRGRKRGRGRKRRWGAGEEEEEEKRVISPHNPPFTFLQFLPFTTNKLLPSPSLHLHVHSSLLPPCLFHPTSSTPSLHPITIFYPSSFQGR